MVCAVLGTVGSLSQYKYNRNRWFVLSINSTFATTQNLQTQQKNPTKAEKTTKKTAVLPRGSRYLGFILNEQQTQKKIADEAARSGDLRTSIEYAGGAPGTQYGSGTSSAPGIRATEGGGSGSRLGVQTDGGARPEMGVPLRGPRRSPGFFFLHL